MTKTFRPYSLDQQLLLPPDMRGWLPEGDLALFVSDVVDALDLAAIYAAYESGEGRGQLLWLARTLLGPNHAPKSVLIWQHKVGSTF